VDQAARRWAKELREKHPEVLRVGYFGSYARGDWGVGSDLDLVVVVEASDLPPRQRAVAFPSEDLPVPAEVLVYTAEEWESREEHSFLKTIEKEVVWVFRCERERG
jgi:predicted nucleotidyltransferase